MRDTYIYIYNFVNCPEAGSRKVQMHFYDDGGNPMRPQRPPQRGGKRRPEPTRAHWSEVLKYWRRRKWNGNHQLLPTTESPTISTSTTSTNLSVLEFQSNSTISNFKKMTTLKENLRMTLPEIEPLQQKDQAESAVNVSSAELDAVGDVADEGPTDRWRGMLPQLAAAIAVSWVSMVIGYTSAYTSPATMSMKRDLNITNSEISWICGLMPLLALVGGLLGGPLIEHLGRKRTLVLTDTLFLCAWAFNFVAPTHWYIYISRMLSGSGVGIASLTLPVYLGETVQPEVRGSLGLLPTAFGNIGILVCFLFGNLLEWRGLAGVGVLLPLPFLLLTWVIPETPRWYIARGKVEESRGALQWLRGAGTNIDKEFEELLESQKAAEGRHAGFSELIAKTNRRPLLIVLGLMFFQQMSGINAIIFYTTQIFADTGSKLPPAVCTTIIGVVNFISTFIATVLIDRLGRKALLYISSVAIVVTLAILGAYFYMMNVLNVEVVQFGWLPLASFVVYVLGFSLGLGPIPWLMMGEVLPARIRGSAASVSTGFNWTCTFVVTTTFPLLKDLLGAHSVFWSFGVLTMVGLVFTVLFVPETRGQSLEDIERKLAGVKVRRMSSVANLKPMPSTF